MEKLLQKLLAFSKNYENKGKTTKKQKPTITVDRSLLHGIPVRPSTPIKNVIEFRYATQREPRKTDPSSLKTVGKIKQEKSQNQSVDSPKPSKCSAENRKKFI
jgi:hypothetical protein